MVHNTQPKVNIEEKDMPLAEALRVLSRILDQLEKIGVRNG